MKLRKETVIRNRGERERGEREREIENLLTII
jgi:hypothetical protein